MAVRTKQLAQWRSTNVLVPETGFYTCPVAKTAIIKGLSIYSGAAQTVYLGIDSGDTHWIWSRTFTGEQGEFHPWWVVLEPGDILVVQNTLAKTVHITLSGAELSIWCLTNPHGCGAASGCPHDLDHEGPVKSG